MHGEIGENLAVNLDPGERETVDEARIGQALIMGAHSSIDPLDPERTEIPLADFPVARCVFLRLVHGLFGDADDVLAAAVVTGCGFPDFGVAGVGGYAAFNS